MDSRPGEPMVTANSRPQRVQTGVFPEGHTRPPARPGSRLRRRPASQTREKETGDGIAPREEACRPHRRSRRVHLEATKAARLEAGAAEFRPIGKLIPTAARPAAWKEAGRCVKARVRRRLVPGDHDCASL